MRTTVVSAICLLLQGCLTATRLPPAPPRTTILGLRIETFTAANGLRVIVVSDPRAPDVQVTMRYQIGAIDDPPDRSGLAHFVEHLMFDKMIDGQTIATRLASLTSYFNATTSFDATTFVERAQPSELDHLLGIEAARLTSPCSAIDAGELQRERRVVLNELRQRERAADVQMAVIGALYPESHPYHRRIGGTLDTIGNVTAEQACAFADEHYVTPNAVLVVSGNLTRPRVEAAVAKQLARVPRRDPPPLRAVAPPPFKPHAIDVAAPIDDPALVLAWPLPEDASLRAKYRAILAEVAAETDRRLDGSALLYEIGDVRAAMLGLAVAAGGSDTYAHIVNTVDGVLDELPRLFEKNDIKELDLLGFRSTQQAALFRTYAFLDDARMRDPLLASYLADGRDVEAEIGASVSGVQQLTRDEAIELSRKLRYSLATAISLRPATATKTGQRVALDALVDEREPRPLAADPADAHRPMSIDVPHAVPGVRTTRLANGLEIVLAPTTSVPTMDIRVVFRTGSADEPSGKRGLALLAGQALTWDLHFLKDLLLFIKAGASETVRVETDHTTFDVHGTSNELDYMLAGMRRWVRDGRYDENADAFIRNIQRARGSIDERAALTDSWRTALFGTDHPYVKAGLMRQADESLTYDDAVRFRREHYTPANATLIVTGDFDPDLAERWIEYLFADWAGAAPERTSPRATVHPTSIATPTDLTQVELTISMPASAGHRAEQLVAAQMLAEIANDVRMQLGASYGIAVRLAEERLSTRYDVTGRIDARQVDQALALIRERIAKLREDKDATARLFVVARHRAVMMLTSLAENSAEVAARVEHDVDLGRPALSDLSTAAGVRDLTIDQMPAVLADLDLSRAAVAMAGPPADMQRAFDVLGRKPVTIAVREVAASERATAIPDGAFVHAYRDSTPHSLAEPITSSHPSFRVAFTLAVGATFATIDRTTPSMRLSDSALGPNVLGEIGYEHLSSLRAGLHVAFDSLDGTDTVTSKPDVTFEAIDLGPFVQYRLQGRFWAGIHGGVHVERDATTRVGAFFGGVLGLDLIKVRTGWLGLFGRYELVSDTESGAVTLGLGYRR